MSASIRCSYQAVNRPLHQALRRGSAHYETIEPDAALNQVGLGVLSLAVYQWEGEDQGGGAVRPGVLGPGVDVDGDVPSLPGQSGV